MADDEMDPEEFEGDDWDVGGMTVGEYRRMAERVKAEGREVFSAEELARFDAAHEVMVRVAGNAQQAVMRMMPDLSEAMQKVRKTAMGSMSSTWSQNIEDPGDAGGTSVPPGRDLVREQMTTPRIAQPQVDEEWFEGIGEARREELERQVAQVEALEQIAGHMAEMKAEQIETSTATLSTASELEKLRDDGKQSGRWTIGLGVVSAAAASAAVLLAVLAYLYPPG